MQGLNEAGKYYYKPRNRKELEGQIKGMKPDYKLSSYKLGQLWKIRERLLWVR
jgi:hypothetical protein